MADTRQYNFQMTIDGEDTFEVYRFTHDPLRFHSGSGTDQYSDSINGDRFSLHVLCNVIEAQKTMLFVKRSDLVTVRLVETYLQNKTLDRIFFVATETASESKTTRWVASLDMKNVSIVGLKTRQQIGALPGGDRLLVDVVNLRANGAFERDYDAKGNPELRPEESKALYNQPG
jgi:hypothetical protein